MEPLWKGDDFPKRDIDPELMAQIVGDVSETIEAGLCEMDMEDE